MIPDLILALAVLAVTGAGIAAAEWLHRRGSVAEAQAQARRDAANGVTAARLRHPSVIAKENL
jgi:translation elongation factor EF-Ts